MSSSGEPRTNRFLTGTDDSTIKENGRVFVTKEKRDILGNFFTLAVGERGCLVAYPETEWQKILERIDSQDSIKPGAQDFSRIIMGAAQPGLSFDAEGRFVVPKTLRAKAKLQEKLTIIGCGKRMEIWAAEEYDAYQADPETYGLESIAFLEKAFDKIERLGPRDQ